MAITVNLSLTATTTDALAGTQLDQVPVAGTFAILAASSVADSTIAVTLGNVTIIDARPLPLRANGQPSVQDDQPLVIASLGGTRPVIAIVEVTAMVVFLIVVFEPAA